MAAPTLNVSAVDNEGMNTCVIEATVATGFEQIAKEELEEKFNTTAQAARGKIIAHIPIKDVKKVLELGCVDNVRAIMTSWKNASLPKDQLECMGYLCKLVPAVDWSKGLAVWKEVYTFHRPISSQPVENFTFSEPKLTSRENQQKKQPKNKKNGRKGDKFKKGGKFDKGDKYSGNKNNPSLKKDNQEGGNNVKQPDSTTVAENEGASCDSGSSYVGEKYNVGSHFGQGDDTSQTQDSICLQTDQQLSDVKNNTSRKDACDNQTCEFEKLGVESKSTIVDSNAAGTGNTHDHIGTSVCTKGSIHSDLSFSAASKSHQTIDLEAASYGVDDFALLSPCSEYRLNVKEQLQEEVEAVVECLSPSEMNVKSCDPSNMERKLSDKKKAYNPLMPAFRVTCHRAGEGHSFDSMCAASNFGGAVQEYFGWNVDMKNYNLEVMLHIDGAEVAVGLGLTRESLHKRNITVFGATTLRPTIAYNMLRMCKILPGDIVCDPMCGSGSIPIQAARGWPEAFHLAGDKFNKAVDRTMENVDALNEELRVEERSQISVDTSYWDTTCLPLKDNSVDVVITDLPFGKSVSMTVRAMSTRAIVLLVVPPKLDRMGSRFNNQRLYPETLMEAARVCRPGTGRVCLLTQDKKCMIKTIQTVGRYWQRRMTLGVNLGGLAAGVYLLTRTNNPVAPRHPGAAVTFRSEEARQESGCRDFRANMPSDPRSGPGFQVIRHTFNAKEISTGSDKTVTEISAKDV